MKNCCQMKNQDSNISGKEFSLTKIVYLVIFLIAIGMVILLGSDTFKSPEVTTSSNNTQMNNPHSSADMSKLQAIKELEDEVKANPSDLELLLKLGHLLNDSGFYEKAIENYKNYLKSKPTDTDVIVDMGVCYHQLGNNAEAIKSMEKAIKLNPDHQIANFNLGIVNISAGNHDEALKNWRRAVEIDPTSNIGKKAKDLLEQH